MIELLEQEGYARWVVLEQDRSLDAPPGPDAGPLDDVRRSIEFVQAVVAAGARA